MQKSQLQTQNKRVSLPTMLYIWVTMLMAIIVYIVMAYVMMNYMDYQPSFSKDFLAKQLFASVDIKTAIYVASFAIFMGGFLYFKKGFEKIKQEVYEMHIIDKDEEFQTIAKKYLTLMIVSHALFEVPAIAGLIIFLMTLDFKSLLYLGALSIVGFIIIIPNREKFAQYL